MFPEHPIPNESFRIKREYSEGISNTEARWFAGAFEAGGTICFRTTNRLRKDGSTYSYSSPMIIIRDTNKKFVRYLHSQYGGSFQCRGKSNLWSLSGYRAADTIVVMKPYIVTRNEVVTAVERWLEADNDERVEIAQEMKGYDRYRSAKIEDYQQLVNDPDFVAGVVDNRGIITITGDTDAPSDYPLVRIYGANKPLLDALAIRYKGIASLLDEAGKEVIIQGHRGITRKESYQLVFQYGHARELIRFVQKSLHLPLYQGWDHLLKLDLQNGIKERNAKIIAHVIEELEAYRNGRLYKLSGNPELASLFSLSTSQLGSVLRLLPENLRGERARIIRQFARKHKDTILDQSIFASLQAELTSFQSDRKRKLRSNHELATEFHVSSSYLNRHILPLLDQDVRKMRATVLRSQWTQENNRKRWSQHHLIGGVIFPE